LATGLSLVLHVLALTGMVVGLKVLTPPPEGRAIEVRLVPSPVLRRRPQPARPSAERPKIAPPLRARPAPEPSPSAVAAALPQTPPPPPQARAGPDPQALRNALRGLTGCADPAANHLNREEKEACDRRLAAARPAPVGPQLSAKEVEQFNAGKTYDPLLVRRAHNGCLPRLANTDRPDHVPPRPTRSGAGTTYGAGCAWSF
jgi:hypothetical protein